ncbi:MAG: DUF3971 domain-containing protein, partial [Phycisphaerae bacterium]
MTLLVAIPGGLLAVFLLLGQLTAPERIRSRALTELRKLASGRVSIGECEFSWKNGIRLTNVAIFEPDLSPTSDPKRPVIQLPELQIQHDLWPLFSGKLRLRSIKAANAVVRMTHQHGTADNSLRGIWEGSPDNQYQSEDPPPSIELTDLRIIVQEQRERSTRVIEELMLTVRGIPSADDPTRYELAWNRVRDRQANGRASWDLKDGSLKNIRNGLPWLSLEAVTLGIATQIDADTPWHDLLGIGGNVRVANYDLVFSDDPTRSPFLEIQWENASLSVPFDDEDLLLDPTERYLQFQQVNGSATIRENSMSAEFTGKLHGATCRVEADFRAGIKNTTDMTLESIGYRLEADIKNFPLPRNNIQNPEEQDFVQDFKPLEIFYRNYQPSGRVDAQMIIEKQSGSDQPVKLERLSLIGQGASVKNKVFPYQVDNLYGTVDFLPDGIYLNNVMGEHNGAQLHVDGYVNKAKPWTGAQIQISGKDVEIDSDLLEALPANFREGLVTLGAAGTVDIHGSLEREDGMEGHSHPWQSFLQADFGDLSACHEALPIPLDGLTGTVLLDKKSVQVIDVQSTDRNQFVTINGAYNFPETGKTYSLEVDAQNMIVDNDTLQNLPQDWRTGISQFDPDGRVDIFSSWDYPQETDGSAVRATAYFHDMTVTPRAFPLKLENVSGTLTLDGRRLLFRDLNASHQDAEITARAAVNLDQSPPQFDAELESWNLNLSDDFVNAAPDSLKEVLQKWQIGGPIQLNSRISSPAGVEPNEPQIDAQVLLFGNTVQHKRFPRPFKDVEGRFRIRSGNIQCDNLRATYNGAPVTASLTANTDAGRMKIAARNVKLDESIRDFFPPATRRAWNDRKPTGQVNVQIDRLDFNRQPDGENEWIIEGSIDSQSLALRGSPEVSDIRGTATIKGALRDRKEGTALSGQLSLDSASMFEWDFQNIETPWVLAKLADGTGQFSLNDLNATAYNGPVNGKIDLFMEQSKSRYELTAAAYGLDAGQIIHKDDHNDHGMHGRADAYLYLSGDSDDQASRRGGGHFEIRNGYLYELPII